MKYIFEAKDIKPGIKVTKLGTDDVWIVGKPAGQLEEQPPFYVVISMYSGKMGLNATPEELAVAFTVENYEPYTGPVSKERTAR